ncbi:MAG: hypothetical protein A4E32_01998 [Methanomassiliicoccales archaeon PtaU1.Bin124]|nr:MAG: hypothetical protein A4E32_01998 [Methanomassiliicoccales archaeon PtaU1.Bin124]
MKPPQYEEMDKGRQKAIPEAFERFAAPLGKYHLVTIPPVKHPQGWCGPIPRPVFEVRDMGGNELVAEFYCNGNYNLYQDDFRPIYDQMVPMIEEAGQRAYLHFLEEYERRRQA